MEIFILILFVMSSSSLMENKECSSLSCKICTSLGCWFGVYLDGSFSCSGSEEDLWDKKMPIFYVGPFQTYDCPKEMTTSAPLPTTTTTTTTTTYTTLPTTTTAPEIMSTTTKGIIGGSSAVLTIMSSVIGGVYWMRRRRNQQNYEQIDDDGISDDDDDEVLYESPRRVIPGIQEVVGPMFQPEFNADVLEDLEIPEIIIEEPEVIVETPEVPPPRNILLPLSQTRSGLRFNAYD